MYQNALLILCQIISIAYWTFISFMPFKLWEFGKLTNALPPPPYKRKLS